MTIMILVELTIVSIIGNNRCNNNRWIDLIMDELIISSREPVACASRRDVTESEKAGLLWIDRVGERTSRVAMTAPRLLGMYGVVHVVKGRGRLHSPPTGWRSLRAGDAFYLFPDTPNVFESAGEWTCGSIVFDGPLANSLKNAGFMSPSEPVIRDESGLAIRACRSIARLMTKVDRRSVLRRSVLLQQLIVDLDDRRVAHGDPRRHLIDGIEAYLDAHCAETVDPARVAERFGVSYSHLRRLFRRHAGMGIKKYVTLRRVDRARRIIAEGDRSLKETAGMCGYDDVYHFMRVFKNVVGVPPGRFAKEPL